ncbi:MAG: M48 family metalloprotease, partial [Sedimentisphaerales bacterium]|nr:M48 family metalloprotease [Sedimentisphaerales bacterium]
MTPIINNLITILNRLGDGFCYYAGSMFVQSGVLIVLLLIFDLLIRKRVRATLRYWIWMLIFVKLILPPSLSLPTGIGYWRGNILSATSHALEEQLTNPPHEITESPHLISGNTILFEIPQDQAPQITAESASPATPVVSPLNVLTWQAVVFVLWLVGVLILSALLIQRILFVNRLIAQSESAKNRFAEILNQCSKQMGIRRPIDLRLSNTISSPAVCGFFKPVILMPTNLIKKLPQDQLRAVLIHELCHIQRSDLWINSVQTILQIIYFYNPLVWLTNLIVRRIREQAVDEMVLVTLGSGAKKYSNTLIDIAEMAFFKTSLSLRLISVVESKKALEGRIKQMLNRPIPKSAKPGILGLVIVLTLAVVLLPMARAQKQSDDDASTAFDLDKDGLENEFEAKLGTNPKSSDTDGDGLSDYDEHCKYRTDPTKKDSDGDGKPDGDWQERREYAYSIRAICEIRRPSSLEMINDLYQDARPVEKQPMLDDARVVEVLIFPFAEPHVYAQPFPKEDLKKKLREYIQPTASMNFSPEMKKKVGNIIQDASTDVEAIDKMLQWMNSKTSLVREMPHWEYLHIIDGDIVWHQSLGSSERDKQFLETNFLGDSMFKNKVHGTCSSTAILRGTLFRAAGIPTRLIQTLPLMTRYSEDPEPLADQLRMRVMSKGYDWGPGSGGANHTYNEVYLNNRWVRVDNSIGTGPFVGDKLFVKAWSAPSWNNLKEEWNDKRCFRAIHVSDAYPKYKTESSKVDIAIEDKDVTVIPESDGRFSAKIRLQNKGSQPIPRFKVHFYAGDPSEGGKKVYPGYHNAGPIMPGSTWNEGTHPFTLNEDETEIFVVVDPDNMIDESDETNNKASAVIQGRQPKKPLESETLSEKTTTKKRSGIDIKPANFEILFDENRGVYRLKVSIHNTNDFVIPPFELKFYRGDPRNDLGEAGNAHGSQHGAGPIQPGKWWGESTLGFLLPDGQY